MGDFLKKKWVLLVVLAVFVALKIPHLFYPYYWDESSPYAPAVAAMGKHGFSLLPTAISPELYRGHPPLFITLAGTWMRIFGSSHIAMHSFALVISVVTLIAVFECTLRLFNARTAAMAVLLTAGQVVFFVQSSFVLPEVLVSLLAFLSLAFYCRQQYLATALSLACLLYTKESGVVMLGVLGADALIRLFSKDTFSKKMLRIAAVSLPVVPVLIFFTLQKQAYGWWFFPLHTKMIDTDMRHMWYTLRVSALDAIFAGDQRIYQLLLAIVAISVFAITKKKFRLLSIVPIAVLLYFAITDVNFATRLNQFVLYTAIFVALSIVFLGACNKYIAVSNEQQKYFTLSFVFIFAFALFSSVNFFTYRYMLESIIPLLVLAATLICTTIEATCRFLYYPALLIIVFISAVGFYTDEGGGDTDLACFGNMQLQQHVVDYLEKNNAYDATIGAGCFIHRVHLTDPATGFLTSNRTFTHVDWDINYADYIIVDNIEPDERYDWLITKDPSLKLVFRETKGGSWVEIYKRTRQPNP